MTRTCDRSENNPRTHQSAQVRFDLLIRRVGSAPVRTSSRGFSAGKVSADLGRFGGAR
jgi:hypothetical protein